MSAAPETPKRLGFLAAIGPAIITASVVLGPGSILSASKIGYQFGYQMVWVLVLAVLLMIGMTALSARLGVVLEGTLCDELAKRAGRPVAALTGITLFLIAACFQFGNNFGVLAALEPFYKPGGAAPILIIVNLNVLVIVALYGFKALYLPVERVMKFLVGVMMIGFAGNLIFARPELMEFLGGLVPSVPEGSAETILPHWLVEDVVQDGKVIVKKGLKDDFGAVTALFATTFSIAGAFYQSYLVRQKGWTRSHLKQGLVDSAFGISILGLITMMILVTAAAVLHPKKLEQEKQVETVVVADDATQPQAVEKIELKTVADVARQLEPTYGGNAARILFCLGIFAGAFSSLLVNAMIGGSILADSLGLGGNIDQRWPKLFTVLALLVGLNVAVIIHMHGKGTINPIIFAQAMTVLGVPLLAGAMLWLATRPDLASDRSIPGWMKATASVSLLIVVFLAIRTGITVYLKLKYDS